MGYPRSSHRVRWTDGGFEMQCSSCLLFVPLEKEEWRPESGLTRCAACWREYKRLKEAGRNQDEIVRELKNTRARLAYAFKRDRVRASAKAWRDRNKDRIREYNRAYRERRRAEINAASRSYYAEAREVILLKKRQSYAERRTAA